MLSALPETKWCFILALAPGYGAMFLAERIGEGKVVGIDFYYLYFNSPNADRVGHKVAEAKQMSIGVRFLTEKSKMTRFILLLFPLFLFDWNFRLKNEYNFHWYQFQHILVDKNYEKKSCYSFKAKCVKV